MAVSTIRTDLPGLDYWSAKLSYDPETGHFTWRRGKRAGTLERLGYRRVSLGQIRALEHRLAYLFMVGKWPETDVDHVNCDRSDNRWSNLRCAQSWQNAGNRSMSGANKSGAKGVRFHRGAFEAQLVRKGLGTLYLGRFKTLEAAANAYDAAATRYFSEFARTNNVIASTV